MDGQQGIADGTKPDEIVPYEVRSLLKEAWEATTGGSLVLKATDALAAPVCGAIAAHLLSFGTGLGWNVLEATIGAAVGFVLLVAMYLVWVIPEQKRSRLERAYNSLIKERNRPLQVDVDGPHVVLYNTNMGIANHAVWALAIPNLTITNLNPKKYLTAKLGVRFGFDIDGDPPSELPRGLIDHRDKVYPDDCDREYLGVPQNIEIAPGRQHTINLMTQVPIILLNETGEKGFTERHHVWLEIRDRNPPYKWTEVELPRRLPPLSDRHRVPFAGMPTP